MGKLADLINKPIVDLKLQDMGDMFQLGDSKRITSEKERHDTIQLFVQDAADVVSVWATKANTISWNGKPKKIAEGENVLPPIMAVYLIQKYGIDNHYGVNAKKTGFYVHDEPEFDAETAKGGPKHFNFAKKQAKAKKTEEAVE